MSIATKTGSPDSLRASGARRRRRRGGLLALVLGAAVLAAPASAFAGNWEWWGYRTNSWETWALATQSPDYVKRAGIPYFGVAAYVIGTSWKWNAQGARSIGKCTGINWSTAPLYVSCSTR